MILNLDMAKAYIWVEWGFLENMEFPARFTSLIMLGVSLTSFAVQIQGWPFGKILPSRCLQQGNPRSPYLFLIMAEGLSALLQQAESRGILHRVRAALSVNHLFFMDESLLFCDA